ncbi:hypothetical protein T261_0871 [Streptomyces lydicus]|nr:hypothetical protein T261_0871 [Streptomyces lydicus]
MGSLIGELEERQAAVRLRMEELEREIAGLTVRLEAERGRLDRLTVMREELAAEGVALEVARPPAETEPVGGASVDLPPVYRGIVDVVDDAPGAVQAKQIVPRTRSVRRPRCRSRPLRRSARRAKAAGRASLTVYLRFPAEHHKRIRHSNFIERTFGDARRRVKVIGRFPGETSCVSLVWAVLDRASRGWRGFTMTPQALRTLQDLRRALLEPPTTLYKLPRRAAFSTAPQTRPGTHGTMPDQLKVSDQVRKDNSF